MNTAKIILDLQNRIDAVAEIKTKKWFENYLKHMIQYRGVKTPEILKIIVAWHDHHRLQLFSTDQQLTIATELIKQNYAEDKFAGIIYIQKYLLQESNVNEVLESAESLFSDGAFIDWSTTDWLCMRILGPTIKRHGINAAKRVSKWQYSSVIWQRRASIVPFRSVISDQSYHQLIVSIVENLVKDQSRFIQTGIGWVISDLSKKFPELAASLIDKNFDNLSLEVVRRHTKYLPEHREYITRKRC